MPPKCTQTSSQTDRGGVGDGEGCARLLVQIVGVIHSGVAMASGAGGRGRREQDNQAVKAQHFQLRVRLKGAIRKHVFETRI